MDDLTTGWECPKCGKVWAPTVRACEGKNCQPHYPTRPGTENHYVQSLCKPDEGRHVINYRRAYTNSYECTCGLLWAPGNV